MYNFYQSPLRKEINDVVYKKPTVYAQFFWVDYQGIVWEKKTFGIKFRWIQFLGVHGLSDWEKEWLKGILVEIHKKYKPIFIQLGFTDIVENISCENVENGIIIENIVPKRIANQKKLEKMGFARSPKENLPPSTYIINTSNTKERLRGKLSSYHRTKIKKAITNKISCHIATTQAEYADFFSILENTGKTKWFNTIHAQKFIDLCEWCMANGKWFLYIATQNDQIVGWSLYLIDPDANAGIYLYGWTNREAWNVGVWHAVNRYAICDLQERWIKTIDLLWWWPIGQKDHPLYNVWLFKEWFGGEKIEFLWSYDLIYNRLFYLLRKMKNKK